MKKDVNGTDFGSTLRRFRQASGLSQEELGAKLGYESANYISCLEIGKRKPTVELLFKIAYALNVAPSELVQDMEKQVEQKQTYIT